MENVRAYSLFDFLQKRFDANRGKLHEAQLRISVLSDMMNRMIWMLIMVPYQAILYGVGGFWLIQGGAPTIGTLLVFANFTNFLIQLVMRLTGINANLAEAEAAFKRIDKFFELPEKKEISFQPTESNSVLAALKGISFGYPEQDKKVFCDLSHDFQAASTTLLWGPSGCGKSTLLKVLYGHLEAEGTLCRKDCRWGILPQAPNLFNITLRENFRLAKPGIDDKEINTFLNKVGMLEDVMAKGQGLDLKIESAENMFSGGQHRRLCIAVFLAADFDALLFDEPTASLDAEKIRLVAGILAELERGKNKSIIIATHEESLREIAVNVMMLDTGSAD